jgi:hypothetical protein
MVRTVLRGAAALVALAPVLCGQLSTGELLAALSRHAETFRQRAHRVVSEEKLLQRSYALPPHPHFAIGKSAGDLRAHYLVQEVVSEYTIASLKGDTSGTLLETREILAKDGKPVQTPAEARKALLTDVSYGEERLRKKILSEFTRLGLLDVATDYGTILLAFTGAGMSDLTISPAGPAWVGIDEAYVFDWQQDRGGALEFRGRKVAHRPMSGRIWLRLSDGMPLRISAVISHSEPKHELQDDAAVEFAPSVAGCAMPVSVVHRHFVDGKILTENLYTYTPFRVFTTDTRIEFGAPVSRE